MIELNSDREDIACLGIAATDLALEELGNQLRATLVATGAFSEMSEVVSLEAAKSSLTKALPSHRQHFIPMNEAAMDLGSGSVITGTRSANRMRSLCLE